MTGLERERLADRLCRWIKRHCAPAKGLLIPISGSDSSLVFWACTQVFREKTLGVHIGEKLHHHDYFASRGAVMLMAPVNREAAGLTMIDADSLRWTMVHAYAKESGFWLMGTRNRTEQTLGTYSIASRVATIQPLSGLWKTQVMELGEHAGLPKEMLAGSRRADPNCGRPKEMAEIGLELIDFYAQMQASRQVHRLSEKLSAKQIAYLNGIYKWNKFKRTPPSPVRSS